MDDLTFAILKRDKMMSRLKSVVISTHIAPHTKIPVPPKNAANMVVSSIKEMIESFSKAAGGIPGVAEEVSLVNFLK